MEAFSFFWSQPYVLSTIQPISKYVQPPENTELDSGTIRETFQDLFYKNQDVNEDFWNLPHGMVLRSALAVASASPLVEDTADDNSSKLDGNHD